MRFALEAIDSLLGDEELDLKQRIRLARAAASDGLGRPFQEPAE